MNGDEQDYVPENQANGSEDGAGQEIDALKAEAADLKDRLLRSLNKLQVRRGLHFTQQDWQTLRKAHDLRLHELLARVL